MQKNTFNLKFGELFLGEFYEILKHLLQVKTKYKVHGIVLETLRKK